MVLMELARGAFDDGSRPEVWASAIVLDARESHISDAQRRCAVPLGRIVGIHRPGDGVALVVGTPADVATGNPGGYEAADR